MKDEVLAKYLPTKKQLSGRLSERGFFFGLLCTLRYQYMKDIIAEAQKPRYTVWDGYSGENGISNSEAWMAELQKHLYHSSKLWFLILVEKPGTAIFLMKEFAKLYRPQNEREQRNLAKRLWAPSEGSSDKHAVPRTKTKRQNLGNGKYTEVPPPKQGDTQMKSGAK
jgi:hypothetical protein